MEVHHQGRHYEKNNSKILSKEDPRSLGNPFSLSSSFPRQRPSACTHLPALAAEPRAGPVPHAVALRAALRAVPSSPCTPFPASSCPSSLATYRLEAAQRENPTDKRPPGGPAQSEPQRRGQPHARRPAACPRPGAQCRALAPSRRAWPLVTAAGRGVLCKPCALPAPLCTRDTPGRRRQPGPGPLRLPRARGSGSRGRPALPPRRPVRSAPGPDLPADAASRPAGPPYLGRRARSRLAGGRAAAGRRRTRRRPARPASGPWRPGAAAGMPGTRAGSGLPAAGPGPGPRREGGGEEGPGTCECLRCRA